MSRGCSSCSRLIAQEDGARIAYGISRLRDQGLRIRFLTLTDGTGTLDAAAAAVAWNKLRGRLRRRGKLGPYVKVAEVTERGRLHLHLLLAGDDDAYIPQAELARLAAASGFGEIADVRELRSEAGVASIAAYLTKPPAQAAQLAERGRSITSYLTKQASGERAEFLRAKFGARMRPVSFARSWPAPIQAEVRIEIRAHYRAAAIAAGTYIEGSWETVTETETIHSLPILRVALRELSEAGLDLTPLRAPQRAQRPPEASSEPASARGPPAVQSAA